MLDMGDPVRIADLARQMIELSGYRPGEDIEIQFSGLRPGEKLYEEISHQKEQLTETGHPKIFRFTSQPPDLATVEAFFKELKEQVHGTDHPALKKQIQFLVPEYQPYLQ